MWRVCLTLSGSQGMDMGIILTRCFMGKACWRLSVSQGMDMGIVLAGCFMGEKYVGVFLRYTCSYERGVRPIKYMRPLIKHVPPSQVRVVRIFFYFVFRSWPVGAFRLLPPRLLPPFDNLNEVGVHFKFVV